MAPEFPVLTSNRWGLSCSADSGPPGLSVLHPSVNQPQSRDCRPFCHQIRLPIPFPVIESNPHTQGHALSLVASKFFKMQGVSAWKTTDVGSIGESSFEKAAPCISLLSTTDPYFQISSAP